ncbi:MAG TPA: DNA methyltransferase [Anaerolineales bacterium]|nr:DNA methyltransferase [Anaerolineales bacterium]
MSGSERKTTGSYYTPSSLIQVLLDSALEPVIAQALDIRDAEFDIRNSSNEERISFLESRLLNLKVCDPACGSGHFLVAAAHRLARRLASVRTGEGEPAPEALRAALRSVISSCIYGVDINPMSVELCKVSLWMEALEPGKPLSFLDAHIQCGDSLVGVGPALADRQIRQEPFGFGNPKERKLLEIPDEAFNPAFGDDKATSTALKKRNKRERGGSHPDKAGQLGFRFEVTHLTGLEDLARWLAERAEQVDAMPEDDSTQVQAKAKAFDDYHASQEYLKNRLELDLWTAAFFWSIPKADAESMLAPTQQELIQLRNGGELDKRLVERVKELAEHLNFFHWELAFPNVFSGDEPGFDCMLGNPPWDMVELSEKEFFSSIAPEIANAPTNRHREKLISDLESENPHLYQKYLDAKKTIYSTRKFIQSSARFQFSSEGRINLYPIFVELAPSLLNSEGWAGIIVPSAISMDAYNMNLFGWLIGAQLVQSLFDFDNKLGVFPAVDSRYRFCLLVLSKKAVPNKSIEFSYLCHEVKDIRDKRKLFALNHKEIEVFSPNTFSPPIFLSLEDANLAERIYLKFGVLINKSKEHNPWQVSIQRMLSLSDPGDYFRKFYELPSPERKSLEWSRLYSGKVIHQYNHRFSTYVSDGWQDVEENLLLNPAFAIETEYYAKSDEVEKRLGSKPDNKWLLCYRDITNATNERTVISTVIPISGCDTTCRNIYLFNANPLETACFLANINSIVFDYFAKQKIIGTHLNASVFEQLPILQPSAYTPDDIDFIAPRVLGLVYTAYDLRPFAEDMWKDSEQGEGDRGRSLRDLYLAQWEANRCDPESVKILERFPSLKDARFPETPFIWNETRRTQLRAELDAYYARLYGLTRDELRYILDPKEVYGEDFPGETFRVLKEKEIKQFGEYRTRRLVLAAWDRLEGK